MDNLSSAATDNIWYFSYGSNLSKDRFKKRTGSLPPSRTVFLTNYRFAFNVHADEVIYANIVPCEGSIVWGAIYWCSLANMETLDIYEGVEKGFYRRIGVEVETTMGERIKAEAYIGGENFVGSEGLPSDDYLQTILTGAAEQKLPQEYIRLIAASGME